MDLSASSRIEEIDSLLAKNLVAARCALGWTQDALSAASGISRATIAQLESGSSDPRLSTVEALAGAFGLTSALLLFDAQLIKAVADALHSGVARNDLSTPQFLRQLEFQLESKALRDAARVAELIKQSLKSKSAVNPSAVLLSSIFGAVQPDPGIAVGVALGSVLASSSRP